MTWQQLGDRGRIAAGILLGLGRWLIATLAWTASAAFLVIAIVGIIDAALTALGR